MKIQLFITCLIDTFFPAVGESVVEVLERAGMEVEMAADQTCCGQPAFNAGYWQESRRMALHTINVFEKTTGPIIVPSGSCGDMIKHRYRELFLKDPINLSRAELLAERTYELSQFLVDQLGIPTLRGEWHGEVAYHPSCHLYRGMGIDQQPKTLLKATGAVVKDLEAECCGFGGVFSVDYADISAEMLKRKINAIEKSGASIVVAGDVSCLMHIEGGLRFADSKIRCAHWTQVLCGKVKGLTEADE